MTPPLPRAKAAAPRKGNGYPCKRVEVRLPAPCLYRDLITQPDVPAEGPLPEGLWAGPTGGKEKGFLYEPGAKCCSKELGSRCCRIRKRFLWPQEGAAGRLGESCLLTSPDLQML